MGDFLVNKLFKKPLLSEVFVTGTMSSTQSQAMWILPRDTVGKATLWTVLKEVFERRNTDLFVLFLTVRKQNLFFELLEHKVGLKKKKKKKKKKKSFL